MLFLVARGSYLGLVVVMTACGLGVGSIYAVNPLQITGGVPAAETGSAISFYQLVRTVAYAIASALSATVLVDSTPASSRFPADAGYRAAALVSTVVLVAALLASSLFVRPSSGRRSSTGRADDRAGLGQRLSGGGGRNPASSSRPAGSGRWTPPANRIGHYGS